MNLRNLPQKPLLGSFLGKNYIYAATMELAWLQLKRTIFGGDVFLDADDPSALALADALNRSSFTEENLESGNFYAKAGFGQETMDSINHDLQQKFPQRTFPDLDLPLGSEDLMAYALLFLKVEYPVPFAKIVLTFDDQPPGEHAHPPLQVKGFSADTPEQKENVEVLSYTDPQHFVARLKLKQKEEEIMVAKGFQNFPPEQLLATLEPFFIVEGKTLEEQDYFQMPTLRLDYTYRYDALIGKKFAHAGFQEHAIALMAERILFAIDEQGAKIESEALLGAPSSAEDGPTPKYLFLDKPFWLLMKKRGHFRPYFILGVNSTDFMEKAA